MIHTGEIPYTCNCCEYLFKKLVLKIPHDNTYRGNVIFNATMVTKIFQVNSHLNIHVLSHLNIHV